MPSLNIDLDFLEHRKTRRLVGLLGPGAEVLILRLWIYAGRYHPDTGELVDLSPVEIESVAGWTGEPGVMFQAMLTVGWIERKQCSEQTLGQCYKHCLHDWEEHQGHLAAFKTRASQAAKARWDKLKGGKNKPQNASSNATSIPSSNAASNAASNALTKPTMLAIPTELSLTNPPDAGVADSPPDHSDPLEVPESLKTPAFMARWAQWQTHRRAFKKPKDWVAMFREQLDWLAQYPADVATEMLSQSIRNGWQGLFETNHNRNGNHHRSVAEERNSFIGQPGCEDDSADVPFV